MSRPTKCRKICRYPDNLYFFPSVEPSAEPSSEEKKEPIIMTVDEYETVRLIDREGLSQQECSSQLGIGRTTAQKIYETARKKLADVLVLGLPLKIEGGDITLCNGNPDFCYKKGCLKNQTLKHSSEYKE